MKLTKETLKQIIKEELNKVLTEQVVEPQTVGDLLKILDAIIDMEYLKNNLLGILFKYLDMATGSTDIDNNKKAALRELKAFLESLASSGIMTFVKGVGKFKMIKAGFTILLGIPIVQKELGKSAAFVLNQIVPGLGILIQGAGVIKKIYGAVKDAAKIMSSSGDAEQKLSAIVQKIATADDNKETTSGFMKHFNIDDRWTILIDDKVEAQLIQALYLELKSADQNDRLEDYDFNRKMLDFLKSDKIYGSKASTEYSPDRTIT